MARHDADNKYGGQCRRPIDGLAKPRAHQNGPYFPRCLAHAADVYDLFLFAARIVQGPMTDEIDESRDASRQPMNLTDCSSREKFRGIATADRDPMMDIIGG